MPKIKKTNNADLDQIFQLLNEMVFFVQTLGAKAFVNAFALLNPPPPWNAVAECSLARLLDTDIYMCTVCIYVCNCMYIYIYLYLDI